MLKSKMRVVLEEIIEHKKKCSNVTRKGKIIHKSKSYLIALQQK